MIVKDEEKSIKRCLDSIKDYVDEIIVVDTGSTDHTVEIVSEYTDKIYHHIWENDFSKHRNQSIQYATCDWIVYIDADEQLHKGAELKNYIPKDGSDAVGFQIHDFNGAGELLCICETVRMWRNGLGIHFQGIVHNQLVGVKRARMTPLRINHNGYKQSREADLKKFRRTSSLLKKQIEAEPDRALTHIYLSNSYAMVNKNEECLKEALTAIRLIEEQDIRNKQFIVAYNRATEVLIEKDKLLEAEEICRKAIDRFDERIDPSAYLVSIYYRLHRWSKLIDAAESYLYELEALLEGRLSPAMRYVTTAGAKADVLFWLAEAYLHTGEVDRALEFYEQTISLSTDHTQGLKRVGAALYMAKHYREARKFLVPAYRNRDEKNDFGLLDALFNIALRTKDEPLKKQITMDVLGLPADENALSFNKKLGVDSFQEGDLRSSLIFFDSVSKMDPEDVNAPLFKGKIFLLKNNFGELVRECDQLLHIINMPRDLTVDSLDDLKSLFRRIADRLTKMDNAESAKRAVDIVNDLQSIISARCS